MESRETSVDRSADKGRERDAGGEPAAAGGLGPLRQRLRDHLRCDETAVVRHLLDAASLPHDSQDKIAEQARGLVAAVRRERVGLGGLDAFLHEFELSSREGVVLMCLAEALLRVPDAATVDRLIQDKIAEADWEAHLGRSDSLFVNASTWALMLTGRVVKLRRDEVHDFAGTLRDMVRKSGEPVIRSAVTQAMRILGRRFVMGRTIGEALERAKANEKKGYRYSYDMLGEAAHTAEDAERYFEAYRKAIAAIGKVAKGKGVVDAPGISVKLSALHPRYVYAQRERVLSELTPRLKALALEAAVAGIGLTVDAEEADRLDLSLDVIEADSGAPDLAGWHGLGLSQGDRRHRQGGEGEGRGGCARYLGEAFGAASALRLCTARARAERTDAAAEGAGAGGGGGRHRPHRRCRGG